MNNSIPKLDTEDILSRKLDWIHPFSFILGKIGEFVPELSCCAQFRPSTIKTSDSVPELSCWAQFRPSTIKTSDLVPELSYWVQFQI